jgi:hypothetical protein
MMMDYTEQLCKGSGFKRGSNGVHVNLIRSRVHIPPIYRGMNLMNPITPYIKKQVKKRTLPSAILTKKTTL